MWRMLSAPPPLDVKSEARSATDNNVHALILNVVGCLLADFFFFDF